ncbi:MAG: peptidoglycan-binding protein [Anaerolineae bacterium]|nr:peptidoglycan-binding protein [Anaerolineae bacterium]
MPDTPKVQKATIVKIDSTGALDMNKTVVCHFNPTQFEIVGRFKWVKRTSIGSDFPKMTFSGGDAQDMTIEFLFDTTGSGEDVRESYKTLLEIAAVDPQQKNTQTDMGEPSLCQFQWGRLLSFNAAISAITQTFVMFKPDGTPIRAKVSVTFSQVGEATQGQNPTSYSETRKVWVVREGDRLDWIAYREYGKAAYWRHIAESNNLADPADLRPGQVLHLVPLP